MLKNNKIERIYDFFCKIETVICMVLFCIIIALVFLSAVLRKFNHPIQWGDDVSMLSFAWLAFMGADIALRKGSLVGVALITGKFSIGVQKFLQIFCYVLIMGMLFILVRYGFPLAIKNWGRSFQSLKISYSAVTLSLDVSAIFMMFSVIHNIIHINDTDSTAGTVSCSCEKEVK